jgi:hypothetical protein
MAANTSANARSCWSRSKAQRSSDDKVPTRDERWVDCMGGSFGVRWGRFFSPYDRSALLSILLLQIIHEPFRGPKGS